MLSTVWTTIPLLSNNQNRDPRDADWPIKGGREQMLLAIEKGEAHRHSPRAEPNEGNQPTALKYCYLIRHLPHQAY